jgi:hypothetical protein
MSAKVQAKAKEYKEPGERARRNRRANEHEETGELEQRDRKAHKALSGRTQTDTDPAGMEIAVSIEEIIVLNKRSSEK